MKFKGKNKFHKEKKLKEKKRNSIELCKMQFKTKNISNP